MSEETKIVTSEIPEDKSWDLDGTGWDLTDNTAFANTLKKMYELYKKKNADYGNSFEKTLNNFGIVAGLIRINDKINRLNQLNKFGNPQIDEKLEDTLIDLANYAAMTYSWLTNKS